jgi:hypothetical protein
MGPIFWYLVFSTAYLIVVDVLLFWVSSASKCRNVVDDMANDFVQRAREQQQRYRDAA